MPEDVPIGVKFHYIKGNFFRVVHVDGGIGGITPGRGIFLALFSERAALPKMVEQALKPDGSLGEEVAREGREGLVREIEVGVMLNASAARLISDWLRDQVTLLEESQPEQPEPSSGSGSMGIQ